MDGPAGGSHSSPHPLIPLLREGAVGASQVPAANQAPPAGGAAGDATPGGTNCMFVEDCCSGKTAVRGGKGGASMLCSTGSEIFWGQCTALG